MEIAYSILVTFFDLLFFILFIFLYPVMGVVFLVKYFKTKNRRLLRLSLLILVPILFVLGWFFFHFYKPELYNQMVDHLLAIYFIVFLVIFPIVLGIIFIEKYSKTKIKKYRLLGLGYFLIPILVFLWGFVSFIEETFFSPDAGIIQCYVSPDSGVFNNTHSPEFISYKESLTEKFAVSLPENVIEKISKKQT